MTRQRRLGGRLAGVAIHALLIGYGILTLGPSCGLH
jgi:hypothetical protein